MQLVGTAVTVCQAPPQGFLEDQLERGWWAGSEAGLLPQTLPPSPTPTADSLPRHNPCCLKVYPLTGSTAESLVRTPLTL